MVTRQSWGGTAFGVADDLPERENRADREAAKHLGRGQRGPRLSRRVASVR